MGENGEKVENGRYKYAFSWLGIVDLLSILPFYLPLIFTPNLLVVRILRLLRLLRIFKLTRFSKSMRTIGNVLRETRADLVTTLFVTFILLVLSSSIMYYVERGAQPDKFASIGHAFWWAVATLTTVGYGDVYPVTPLGKLLSGIIAIVGIGFIALPTGIISSAFIDQINARKAAQTPTECECPDCGKKFKVDSTGKQVV